MQYANIHTHTTFSDGKNSPEEMIQKAHAHGIRCNIFWANHTEEAKQYLEMGIDCILTNRYQHLKQKLGIQ